MEARSAAQLLDYTFYFSPNVFVYLSIYIYIIYPTIHLSIYLSIYLSIPLQCPLDTSSMLDFDLSLARELCRLLWGPHCDEDVAVICYEASLALQGPCLKLRKALNFVFPNKLQP